MHCWFYFEENVVRIWTIYSKSLESCFHKLSLWKCIYLFLYIYACMYIWKALFCRIKETFLNVAWGQKSLHNFNKWSVGYIDLLSFYRSQLPHKQLWTCQILEAGWNLAGYSKLRLLLTEIFCLGTESNYEFWLWSRFASGRKYFLYKDSNFDTLFSHAFI